MRKSVLLAIYFSLLMCLTITWFPSTRLHATTIREQPFILEKNEGAVYQAPNTNLPGSALDFQLLGPENPQSVLILGRVLVKWDGYQGLNHTDSNQLTVVIDQHAYTIQGSTTEIVRQYTVVTDENGYYFLEGSSRHKFYGYRELKIKKGTIPVPYQCYVTASKDSQIISLGTTTLTVNEDGIIGVTIVEPTMIITKPPGGNSRMILSNPNPLIHNYFLENFKCGAWDPVIKTELSEALAARALLTKRKARAQDREKEQAKVRALVKKAVGYQVNQQNKEAIEHYKMALAMDPLNQQALDSIVYCLRMADRAIEAEAILKQILEQNPCRVKSYQDLAELYSHMDRHIEAAILLADVLDKLSTSQCNDNSNFKFRFSGAIDRENEKRNVMAYLETVLLREPDFNKKMAFIDELMKQFPGILNWKSLKGKVFRDEGRYENAEQCFLECVRLAEDKLPYYFNLVDFYQHLERPGEAAIWLQRIIEMIPEQPRLLLKLRNRIKILQDIILMKNLVEHYLERFPHDTQMRRDFAVVCKARRKFKDAESYLRECMELEPDKSENYRLLAMVYSAQDRHLEGARLLIEAMKSEIMSNNHILLGQLLLDEPDSPEKIHFLEQLTREFPENSFYFHQLAVTCKNQNLFPEAETHIRKCIAFEPEKVKNYLVLAGIFTADGRFKEASDTLFKALEIEGDNVTILDAIGRCYRDMGNRNAAVEALFHSLTVDQDRDETYRVILNMVDREHDVAWRTAVLEKLVLTFPSGHRAWEKLANLYESNDQLEKTAQVYREGLERCGSGNWLLDNAVSFHARHGDIFQAANLIIESAQDDDSVYRSYCWQTFSAVLWEAGKKDLALELLLNLLKKKPEHFKCQALKRTLASEYKKRGEIGNADGIYKKAIVLYPDDYYVYKHMIIFYGKQRRFKEAGRLCLQAIRKFPKQAVQIYELIGNILRRAGEYDQAINWYLQGKEKHPTETAFWDGLIDCYYEIGTPEKAVPLINMRAEPNPRSYAYGGYKHSVVMWTTGNSALSLKYARAILDSNRGNYRDYWSKKVVAFDYLARDMTDEAVAVYRKAVELYPNDSSCHMALGEFLMELGQPGKAIPVLKKALDISPWYYNWWELLSKAYAQAGNNEAALLVYDEALGFAQDKSHVIHSYKADLLTGLGRFDEALKHYRLAVENSPSENSYRLKLARALLRLNHKKKAESELRKIVMITPWREGITMETAKLYDALGQPAKAIKVLEDGLAFQDPNTNLLVSLGELYERHGEEEAALNAYKQALNSNPDQHNARILLGQMHKRRGHFEAAIAEFENVVSYYRERCFRNPFDWQSANNLAWILADEDINVKEALDWAKKSVSLKTCHLNLDTLGWVYYKLGRFDEAVEWHQEAINNKLDNAASWYHLSLALWQLEKREKAREIFDFAVRLDPINRCRYKAERVICNSR